MPAPALLGTLPLAADVLKQVRLFFVDDGRPQLCDSLTILAVLQFISMLVMPEELQPRRGSAVERPGLRLLATPTACMSTTASSVAAAPLSAPLECVQG